MSVLIKKLKIFGAFVATPSLFPDMRGHFFETWRADSYADAGIEEPILQDSVSCSNRWVVRGMHFQTKDPQGQLVTIAYGRVLDVIVDLRRGSPTFLKHESFELDYASPQQVYMPPGVAHGFCVLSEVAVLIYKATRYYQPETQRGIRWNDPDIGIDWPASQPLVSPRDAVLPLLKDVPVDELPLYA